MLVGAVPNELHSANTTADMDAFKRVIPIMYAVHARCMRFEAYHGPLELTRCVHLSSHDMPFNRRDHERPVEAPMTGKIQRTQIR